MEKQTEIVLCDIFISFQQIGDEQSKVEFEAAVSTLTAELNYTKDELKCAKNELTKRTEEYLGIEGEVKELRARLEEKIEKVLSVVL